MTAEQARALERCVAAGGVALFPADTVYGLCCDPDNGAAVARLYALKGREPRRPCAVMSARPPALPELGARTRAALEALLPGPLTVLVANPRGRWPLACGPDRNTLGLRVPDIGLPDGLVLMQSSANPSGGPDPSAVADVDDGIRAGADLVLDAGPLPGVPSTVLDLRALETGGEWRIVREGAAPAGLVADALSRLPTGE